MIVRGYEPARLRRAASLAVKKLGPRQYRVRGQEQEYYDVSLDTDPACYCIDSQYKGGTIMCKHETAARLHDGDAGLLQSLGNMLLAQQKIIDATMKQAKRKQKEKQ